MKSPYENVKIEKWEEKTLELINEHPLDSKEVFDVVNKVWQDIFSSGIGSKPFKIGKDLFPRPQIMGFFLHELIPLEFAFRYPDVWRKDKEKIEKDMVCLLDNKYSFEIKTSSSSSRIYGNRSYAQKGTGDFKSKSGYYLAINFEKFTSENTTPGISLVRFGWLDHEDWVGQESPTGQQAHIPVEVERKKLLTLPLK
ncbi:MAG: ScaI family restriction endonuclease [Tissierellales bacterium]|nr:ScaI family restriction endonuclease [Tissierellales bacterium]